MQQQSTFTDSQQEEIPGQLLIKQVLVIAIYYDWIDHSQSVQSEQDTNNSLTRNTFFIELLCLVVI